MINVAIIGANGFIGKHLVLNLLKNNNVNLFLFGRNKSFCLNIDLPYFTLNLNDSSDVLLKFKNINVVYYLASTSIPSTSWECPKKDIEENLIPFVNFLECMALLSIKKIIFTSSAGTIYGKSEKSVIENSNKSPFTPYGINKLSMEHYLDYFNLKYGIKNIVFRISNIYGEGLDTSKGLGVINTFIEDIIINGQVSVYGDGEVIRDYIYIKDVINIMSLALNESFYLSKTYNLSSGNSLSVNQLIRLIGDVVKFDFKINFYESRKSDNPVIRIDNSKLKQDFKIEFTDINKGINNTFSHIYFQLSGH